MLKSVYIILYYVVYLCANYKRKLNFKSVLFCYVILKFFDAMLSIYIVNISVIVNMYVIYVRGFIRS